MAAFKLDPRLQADCFLLLEQEEISYLLHKNADVAWFILVPHVDEIEFTRLDSMWQQRLLAAINRLSGFIQSHFAVDKINVASIGNVVSQLHVHVIGRHKNDAYWPDVVWGKPTLQQREETDVQLLSQQLPVYLALEGDD